MYFGTFFFCLFLKRRIQYFYRYVHEKKYREHSQQRHYKRHEPF